MDILTRFIGNNQPLPKPTSLAPRYPWACELLKLDRRERATKARARNADIVLKKYEGVFRELAAK